MRQSAVNALNGGSEVLNGGGEALVDGVLMRRDPHQMSDDLVIFLRFQAPSYSPVVVRLSRSRSAL